MQRSLDGPRPFASTFPLQIDRVKALAASDVAAVRAHTLRPVEPVLLRAFDPGGSSLQWTFSSLRALAGESTVRVSTPDRGLFASESEAHERAVQHMARSRMKLREYLDILTGEPDTTAYMQAQSLRQLPRLAREIDLPPNVVPSDRLVDGFLWIGPHASATPLHFDETNNLLCVLRGRKRVLLFRPSDVINLYPASVFARQHPIASRINLLEPDVKRFPRAARAILYDVVVEAGNALVLPACWWHQVHNIGPTIAVNYWWRPHVSQYFAPAVLYNAARAWVMSATRLYRQKISRTYVE